MLLYGEWLGLDVRLAVVTLFLDDGVWYTSDVLPRRWSESVRDCRFSFSGIGGGPSTSSCCECWDTNLFVEKKNYFLIVSKYHFDISNQGSKSVMSKYLESLVNRISNKKKLTRF